MSVFIVTVDDGKLEHEAREIRGALEADPDVVGQVDVEKIECIHRESDDNESFGLSYRVTDVA